MGDRCGVLGVGAHPDDLEGVMGGTAVKLAARGLRVLFVDLCPGEPARHAARGARSGSSFWDASSSPRTRGLSTWTSYATPSGAGPSR